MCPALQEQEGGDVALPCWTSHSELETGNRKQSHGMKSEGKKEPGRAREQGGEWKGPRIDNGEGKPVQRCRVGKK